MALHLSSCLRQPLASRAPPSIRTRQPAKPSSRRIARSAIRSKRPATAPLAKATPLREVYLKYPIEQLEEGFAEGMGSRHRDMPQIQFSTEQVVAILSYLGGITGVDPSLRPRIPPSGETPPSPTLRRGV
jgi:hypothetical protein